MFFDSCPICDNGDAEIEGLGSLERRFAIDCPTCGRCKLSDALKGNLDDDEDYLPDRHVLSFLVREATAQDELLDLHTRNVEGLMQAARMPDSPAEKMDRILAHLRKESNSFGAEVELDEDSDYPLAGARDAEEFKRLVAELVKDGLCNENSGIGLIGEDSYSLTTAGWERAEGVQGPATGGTQAFVAMWFDDDMDDAYESGIRLALEECGYVPLCVKYEPHNERIDTFIEEEIRKSSLVVADFTGHRQSVYYEVGLARGCSIPVIWTCHAGHMDGCHFDTRQYNHVVWDEPDDLRAKLVERIKGAGLARA